MNVKFSGKIKEGSNINNEETETIKRPARSELALHHGPTGHGPGSGDERPGGG